MEIRQQGRKFRNLKNLIYKKTNKTTITKNIINEKANKKKRSGEKKKSKYYVANITALSLICLNKGTWKSCQIVSV